nr:hypothetical protein [Proteus mirabilis]
MYQRPYLKEWDDYLNYLIDECSIADERYRVIIFNDGGEKVEVWKENKYYGYGNQHNVSGGEAYEFRPSFRTIIKLSNLVDSREKNRVSSFARELKQKVRK